MIHNSLRRHEGQNDQGSWSFAPCADRSKGMLFQIMGPGPACDQERVVLTHVGAFSLADALRAAASTQFPMDHTLRDGTAHITLTKSRGSDDIAIRLTGGTIGDDVTASMLPYDALEAAMAIYHRTLEVQIDDISPPGDRPTRSQL